MTIRIENATQSLAYVRVARMVGTEPVEETAEGKTFDVGVRVIISTRPQDAERDDLVESRPLHPGENIALTDEYEFAEFEFAKRKKDPDIVEFCVEDMDGEDERGESVIGYRIVATGTLQVPPKHLRH